MQPDTDRHQVITLVVLALVAAGNVWGLGRWWSGMDVVRRHPWLR
jgi:thiosulfate dehydrogenase [quinone] large subunit